MAKQETKKDKEARCWREKVDRRIDEQWAAITRTQTTQADTDKVLATLRMQLQTACKHNWEYLTVGIGVCAERKCRKCNVKEKIRGEDVPRKVRKAIKLLGWEKEQNDD